MKKVLIERLPSRALIYVIAFLMKIWMCFVVLSCRKIVIGKEHAEAMQNGYDSYIKAMWHRNILMGPTKAVQGGMWTAPQNPSRCPRLVHGLSTCTETRTRIFT